MDRLEILRKKADEFLVRTSRNEAPISREITNILLPIFRKNYENQHSKPGDRTVFSGPFVDEIRGALEQNLDVRYVHPELSCLIKMPPVESRMDLAIEPKRIDKSWSFISCKICVDPLGYRESFATAYFLSKYGSSVRVRGQEIQVNFRKAKFFIVGTHCSSKKGNFVKLGEKDDVQLKSYYLWDVHFFDELVEELRSYYSAVQN